MMFSIYPYIADNRVSLPIIIMINLLFYYLLIVRNVIFFYNFIIVRLTKKINSK